LQPNPSIGEATVEEIDALLNGIAARCRFSSPAVKVSQPPLTYTTRDDLERMYRRLRAVEAKWFTRLVLKDYQPVVLDPGLVYQRYDSLLPLILRVHESFDCALSLLQAIKASPGNGPVLQKTDLMAVVKPRLGVKVGRQFWLKGRSIKHCMDIGYGRMSCEQKVDGEYCQVHIDLAKGRGSNCIQIFSKSGKDSTKDRARLHG
jgi:DNA ligase 4